MQLEFRTEMKNGKLDVPVELQGEIDSEVRVIVQTRKARDGKKSYLRELIDNPIELPNFKPMTRDEIYDRDNF